MAKLAPCHHVLLCICICLCACGCCPLAGVECQEWPIQAVALEGNNAYNTSETLGQDYKNMTCADDDTYTFFNTFFFAWTPTVNGTYNINNCETPGDAIDTVLAVFDSAACFRPNSPAISPCPLIDSALAFSDDGCGSPSAVEVTLTADTTYIIAVGQYDDFEAGAGVLEIASVESRAGRKHPQPSQPIKKPQHPTRARDTTKTKKPTAPTQVPPKA